MRTIYTKKAVSHFVKTKDTKSIITLYELDKKKNPPIQTIEEIERLSHLQKEVLKEQIKNGVTFGLPGEFINEIKDKYYLREYRRSEYPF